MIKSWKILHHIKLFILYDMLLHYIKLHCVALHYILLYCMTLHDIVENLYNLIPYYWTLYEIKGYLIVPYHIPFSKGNLVGKLPSSGRMSWLAFPSSCQPHHHVNHPS